MRKLIGYGLLTLSCMAWALLLLVPFLPLDGEQKLVWGGALYVFGQLTWFGCLPFLGPEFVERSRQLWRRLMARIRNR